MATVTVQPGMCGLDTTITASAFVKAVEVACSLALPCDVRMKVE